MRQKAHEDALVSRRGELLTGQHNWLKMHIYGDACVYMGLGAHRSHAATRNKSEVIEMLGSVSEKLVRLS